MMSISVETASFPMETAPIQAGVEFSPCLLWAKEPALPERWLVGGWSGENWCSEQGWIVIPTARHPLPAAPALSEIDDSPHVVGGEQC